MAPTKPAPKAAAKPPASAAGESIFAAMRKNGRLAKHSAKAKKVVAIREFDGPDGDYSTVLTRTNHYTKDGSLGIIFEFRVTDPGEVESQKLLLYFSFKDGDYETIEEVQNRFYETLQLIGIPTDCEDAELEKMLLAIISTKQNIVLRVKTNKRGGKFCTVIGAAEGAAVVAATEYVEEGTVEEVVEEVVEETDEWEEEVPEEEVVEEEEEAVEEEVDWTLPSSWVGYAMVYKSKEVEVISVNDDTLKCTIKDVATNKKVIVPFTSLTPPAE